jgi:hypothetical protein
MACSATHGCIATTTPIIAQSSDFFLTLLLQIISSSPISATATAQVSAEKKLARQAKLPKGIHEIIFVKKTKSGCPGGCVKSKKIAACANSGLSNHSTPGAIETR